MPLRRKYSKSDKRSGESSQIVLEIILVFVIVDLKRIGFEPRVHNNTTTSTVIKCKARRSSNGGLSSMFRLKMDGME